MDTSRPSCPVVLLISTLECPRESLTATAALQTRDRGRAMVFDHEAYAVRGDRRDGVRASPEEPEAGAAEYPVGEEPGDIHVRWVDVGEVLQQRRAEIEVGPVRLGGDGPDRRAMFSFELPLGSLIDVSLGKPDRRRPVCLPVELAMHGLCVDERLLGLLAEPELRDRARVGAPSNAAHVTLTVPTPLLANILGSPVGDPAPTPTAGPPTNVTPRLAHIRVTETRHGRNLIVRVTGPPKGLVRIRLTSRIRHQIVASASKTVDLNHGKLSANFTLGPRVAREAQISIRATLGAYTSTSTLYPRHR
jgi:hypothetical protein